MPPRVEVVTDPVRIAEQLVRWLDQPDDVKDDSLEVRRQQAAIDRMEERLKGGRYDKA